MRDCALFINSVTIFFKALDATESPFRSNKLEEFVLQCFRVVLKFTGSLHVDIIINSSGNTFCDFILEWDENKSVVSHITRGESTTVWFFSFDFFFLPALTL